MGRLTKRTPAGVGILEDCDECTNGAYCLGVCVAQDKANTRLAEYEDTGLTPAEVMELKAENKELRGRLERVRVAAMP